MKNYFKITTEKEITTSKGITSQDLVNVLKKANVDANVNGFIKNYKWEKIINGEVIATEIIKRR